MSKKVKIELNSKGIQELLSSAEMQTLLAREGANMAARAGNGYDSRVHVMPNPRRAAVNVYPSTPEAAKDNYQNNTLVKVIS